VQALIKPASTYWIWQRWEVQCRLTLAETPLRYVCCQVLLNPKFFTRINLSNNNGVVIIMTQKVKIVFDRNETAFRSDS
jgi:hypothetical protein